MPKNATKKSTKLSFVSNEKFMTLPVVLELILLILVKFKCVLLITHETILDLLDKGFKVEQIPVRAQYFEDRVSRR
jgi:hypothetical protein